MYFNSETVLATRLAALDHYRQASNILLDSTARLFDLYNDTGSKALGIARHGGSLADPVLIKQLAPEFLIGHLRIAGHAHEDMVRLIEAQLHSSNRLAKFALDKTAQMSPPMLELAIGAVESLIDAGEDAADGLGDASLKAIGAVEKKLARPAGKKKPRP